MIRHIALTCVLGCLSAPAFAFDWDVDAEHRLYVGAAASNSYGFALAAGDIDNDGRDDVVIGTPEATTTSGANSGTVRIFLEGSTATSTSEVFINGFAANDHAGLAVEVGDFDGDGFGDVAVGVPDRTSTDVGAVFVWYGPLFGTYAASTADVVIAGGASGDRFGRALTSSDVDGDGNDELIVGAPLAGSADGRIYIFDGGTLASATGIGDAFAELTGVSGSNEKAGFSIAADEYMLVVGAPEGIHSPLPGTGRVYTVDMSGLSGSYSLYTNAERRIDGTTATRLGERVSITHDGSYTALASSRGSTTPAAKFYMFLNISGSGSLSLADAYWQTAYPATPTLAWPLVPVSGEFRGDGGDHDIVFGDPNRGGGGASRSGRVTLIDDATTQVGAVSVIGDPADAGDYIEFWDDAPTTTDVGFGSAIAVGDFNGDGKHDFVASAPGDDTYGTNYGSVQVFLGPFAPVSGVIDDTGADASVEGQVDDDLLGYAVEGIGDINGDGFDDLAMGAPGARSDAGDVYIFFGPRYGNTSLAWKFATLDPASADLTFEGSAGAAGWSVAGLGDLDDDGFDDFAIGAPEADLGATNRGAVYVFYGDATLAGTVDPTDADATFYSSSTRVQDFGWSVAGIGDWNRDGDRDIAIGDPSYDNLLAPNAGLVAVLFGDGATRFSGSINVTSGSAGCFLLGGSGDGLGYSIAPEVSWDGTNASLAAGAPYVNDTSTDEGAVYVLASTTGACPGGSKAITSVSGSYVYRGSNTDANLGFSMDALPDLSGDGKDELVVGSPGAWNDTHVDGLAYVVWGSMATGDVDGSDAVPLCGRGWDDFWGVPHRDGHVGWSVAGSASNVWHKPTSPGNADIWDVDATPDVAVGMPQQYAGLDHDSGSWVEAAGAVWVYEGSDILAWDPLTECVDDPAYIVLGTQELGRLGESVALVGDVSLDNMPDLMVGNPLWDAGVSDADRGVTRIVLSSH